MNDDFKEMFNTFHDKKSQAEQMQREREAKWKADQERWYDEYKKDAQHEFPIVCQKLSDRIVELFKGVNQVSFHTEQVAVSILNCSKDPSILMGSLFAIETTVEFNAKKVSFVPKIVKTGHSDGYDGAIDVIADGIKITNATIYVLQKKGGWVLISSAGYPNGRFKFEHLSEAMRLYSFNDGELKKILKQYLLSA
jgi:hypothetical protein